MMAQPLPDRIAAARIIPPPETGVTPIHATSYRWRDPSTIPVRAWVCGRQLLRGTVSLIVAPGGTGKSALMTGVALALASGQGILNNTVWNGLQRCWLWNLEDSGEELARSIQAAALHWQFEEADLEGRLYVDSGLDGAVLRLAEHDQRSGCCIVRPVAEALQEELRTRQIDVLIVDPFVSSHAVPENDNGAIDAVAKEWARIAVDANCAICLVHHARKGNGADVDADSARGASALVAAARFALALNTMSKDEAERFGIEEEDRRTYFRADNAKSNRAPAGDAEWYRLHSVALGNGWLDGGDHLPVAVPWSPPNPFDDVTRPSASADCGRGMARKHAVWKLGGACGR